MFNPQSFFIPGYRAVYLIAAASIAGTLIFAASNGEEWLYHLLTNRWTPQYLLLSPFMHAGLMHALLNIMGLHFIGGQMLSRLIGEKRFLLLFAVAALTGTLLNNFLSNAPAIGISAAVLGMLSCALYPYGRAPMKFLFIHDILRLPPFPLYGVAAFIVMLDIAGILFGWGFFAHWAHLGGFAAGGIVGWFIFSIQCTSTRSLMCGRKKENKMNIIFTIGGAVFGLLIIRGFMLDSIEEIAWRIFWNQLFQGNIGTEGLGKVLQSSTFIKCLIGTLAGGGLGMFIAAKLSNSNK